MCNEDVGRIRHAWQVPAQMDLACPMLQMHRQQNATYVPRASALGSGPGEGPAPLPASWCQQLLAQDGHRKALCRK